MPNGMKSGSGEDPFEDAVDTDDTDTDTDETDTDDRVGLEDELNPREESATAQSDPDQASGELPWKYARENVKEGRGMVQFFLQKETQQMESEAVANVESMLEEDVSVIDLREAAYRVALEHHSDEVAQKLREWGYDY